MKPIAGIVAAAAMGALATHFMDPQQGRRRRAVLRDKLKGRFGKLDEAGRVIAEDLRNRTQGTLAELWHRVGSQEVDDAVLVERVRSKIGRVVSHPGAIEVAARQGVVTLRGPVLRDELRRLMQAVWTVPGVHGVEDELEPHRQPGDVPGLQGGAPRRERIDILQDNWAPATRALVGGAGGLLALYSLARGSYLRTLLGAALAVRAATNMGTRRLLGQRGRRGIDFTKTLTIAAPLDEVFAFWSNFENFPRFMRNVRAVRRNADGSWRWEVVGPLGATAQWNANVTQHVPNERIAWSTTPDSMVQHAGIVRFQRDGEGTRVQVKMTYSPPAGAAGHLVASLLGADPKTEMDEDLMRLKAYFETGKPARDAARAL